MSDTKQRPGAEADHKPQNQTGEEHGNVKGQQVTDRMMREKDLARGSEPDTAGASHNRR